MRTAILFLLLANQLPARWWEAKTDRAVVISEGGDRSAREFLTKILGAHRVFRQLFPSAITSPLPITAFELSPSRYRAIRPTPQTSGYYQSAPDRDYIVLDASTPARVIFHEYTHLVLNHTTGPLPKWLEEGLAEFHSTLAIGGTRVRLGTPIPEHVALLSREAWLDADALSRATFDSIHETSETSGRMFYAQSWALVHMLRFDGRYRARFPQFLQAVASGESQAQAFQRVFESSLSEAITHLKRYLQQGSLAVVEVALEGGVARTPAADIAVTPMSDLEGELAYGTLALQSNHPEIAVKLYRKLAAGKGNSARVQEALGLLAPDRGTSLDHYRQAMAFPDASGRVYFEYAMQLREAGVDKGEVAKNLRLAVERNPELAEGQFLLGTFSANENRHAEAIPHLEKAASILPRQSYFWHALAVSYHALGQSEKARLSARRSQDAATTSQEAEMARDVLRLADEPAGKAEKKAAVLVPESWKNKEGDARMEGVLERIDCLGRSARFHVRSGGKLSAFWVENPGEVLLKNASSVTFEFRCGPLKPVPIVVNYTAKADTERMTLGVVNALEFR